MNIRGIEPDIATQFFNSVTLRADGKTIRNNAVFAVTAIGEEGNYCIFTFLLCPNNEYNYLAVRIIRISSTGFFPMFGLLLYLLLSFSTANADWHGELSYRSDYVYRGYSKSQGNPVAQGLIDYQGDSGWFGGLGLSQVNFDNLPNTNSAEVEFKPYMGWALPIATDWSTELTVSGYIYNDIVFGHNADYAEISATLHYQDWLSGKISVAPNAYQRHATVPSYELNYRHDIFDTLQFSGGLGYSQAFALLGQDYFYWNLGVSWFVTSYLTLDARYIDVHLNNYNDSDYDDLKLHGDEYYPRPINNKYLLSITLGF
ncbi:MAG: TorF family putative porin [Methylococcaceae bacterium]